MFNDARSVSGTALFCIALDLYWYWWRRPLWKARWFLIFDHAMFVSTCFALPILFHLRVNGSLPRCSLIHIFFLPFQINLTWHSSVYTSWEPGSNKRQKGSLWNSVTMKRFFLFDKEKPNSLNAMNRLVRWWCNALPFALILFTKGGGEWTFLFLATVARHMGAINLKG